MSSCCRRLHWSRWATATVRDDVHDVGDDDDVDVDGDDPPNK